MAWMQRVLAAGILAAFAAATPAQTPPSYDFNFATIGAAGNAPFTGDPISGAMAGRGGVQYAYRMSRYEVSTSQWMEFVNTYSTLGGPWTDFGEPVYWGAEPDPAYSGPGMRWRLSSGLSQAGQLPVGGLTWRTAAMYCNWLHNGKAPGTSSLSNGAYDTSTFGAGPVGLTFNDQWHHNPNAKFWIPTLDEWLKASYYDPNRYGPGSEGWWEYSYSRLAAPIPGAPGAGQTSAGYPGADSWQIPLGAYTGMHSPWGLFDTSGGASEWTEEVEVTWHPTFRTLKGSAAGPLNLPELELIWGSTNGRPGSRYTTAGLRIASAIPSPGAGAVLVGSLVLGATQRRRRIASGDRRRVQGRARE